MIYSSIIGSTIKIESLIPSIAKDAGIIKSTNKNIPIGDCIIATTAIKNQAIIISDVMPQKRLSVYGCRLSRKSCCHISF